MTIDKTIQILGENVRRLRKSELTPEGSRSINEFAKWAGVANGTVDRIEKGETDPQISHVLKIAAKFQNYGVRAWHMFVPELDPTNLPELVTASEVRAYDDIADALDRLRGDVPGAMLPTGTQVPRVAAHKRRKAVTKGTK